MYTSFEYGLFYYLNIKKPALNETGFVFKH